MFAPRHPAGRRRPRLLPVARHLSRLLAENPDTNLSEKQVEFAQTIHASGTDLLELINDILDLSKIESGTVTLDIVETSFSSLRDHMDRTF